MCSYGKALLRQPLLESAAIYWGSPSYVKRLCARVPAADSDDPMPDTRAGLQTIPMPAFEVCQLMTRGQGAETC